MSCVHQNIAIAGQQRLTQFVALQARQFAFAFEQRGGVADVLVEIQISTMLACRAAA